MELPVHSSSASPVVPSIIQTREEQRSIRTMSHTSRALGTARPEKGGAPSSVAALSAARAMRQRRVRQELQDDQKKELKDAFELFDADKRGSIDYHELKVLMRALGFQVAKKEVVALVDEVDVHRSGRVDFNDYMEIMRRKILARDPDEEITRAFQLFDEDGTGKITLRKMRRVAKELGENLGDDELQAMIDEFDQNQDGEIDLSEFFAIMKQSTEF